MFTRSGEFTDTRMSLTLWYNMYWCTNAGAHFHQLSTPQVWLSETGPRPRILDQWCLIRIGLLRVTSLLGGEVGNECHVHSCGSTSTLVLRVHLLKCGALCDDERPNIQPIKCRKTLLEWLSFGFRVFCLSYDMIGKYKLKTEINFSVFSAPDKLFE